MIGKALNKLWNVFIRWRMRALEKEMEAYDEDKRRRGVH